MFGGLIFTEYLWAIIVTIVYSGASLVLGLLLMDRFFAKRFSFLILYSTAFLLGQGILGSLWLFLGLGSVLYKPVIWGVLALILAFSFLYFMKKKEYRKTLNAIRQTYELFLKLPIIWQLIFLSILGLILLLGILSLTRLPDGDAAAFYMVWPKIISYSGSIRPQPNFFDFSQIGISGEMHFAALMSIGNAMAAQFLTWFNALALIGILMGFGKMLKLSNRAQIIALAILLSTSTFTLYIYGGKVDIFGAAFGLAAYFWIFSAFDGQKIKYPFLIFGGLFMGWAFVAKFPNLIVIAPGIILIVLVSYYRTIRENFRLGAKELAVTSLIIISFFILATFPHLLKNYILFNEPLAPFYFSHYQGLKWADQTWFNRENIRYILLSYPVALTFGQYPMQGGNLSFFVLALAPLGILMKWDRHSEEKKYFYLILSVFLVGIAAWMVFRPGVLAPRYILATLLLSIPLVAKITDMVVDNHPVLRFCVVASLLITLVILLITNFKSVQRQLYLVKEYAAEFNMFSYRSSTYINETAAAGDRVFVAGYYTYFLRPDILQCLNTQNERDASAIPLQAPAVWDYLYHQGFKYVVVQKISYPKLLETWDINRHSDGLEIKEAYNDNFVTVFTLIPTKMGSADTCLCTSPKEKVWQVECPK